MFGIIELLGGMFIYCLHPDCPYVKKRWDLGTRHLSSMKKDTEITIRKLKEINDANNKI